MTEKKSDKDHIDLRGLACPEPVLRTKKLLDQKTGNVISLLVDTDVTVNNLERLTKANNAKIIESQKIDNHFRVLIAPGQNESQPSKTDNQTKEEKPKTQVGSIIFISKDTFGQGATSEDHTFSNHLLNTFLQSMQATGHEIEAILIANSGVKILSADSACKSVLEAFEASGTRVFACGLCVEYYGLKEVVPQEKITNMFAICEYLMTASRVIEP